MARTTRKKPPNVPSALVELDHSARTLRSARERRRKLDAELSKATADEAAAERGYASARASAIKAYPELTGI